MAILSILRYPDARLHKTAAPITVFDASLKALVRDMAETMYAAPGIGLSATQVDRKSTRLNSSHIQKSRMPSSA